MDNAKQQPSLLEALVFGIAAVALLAVVTDDKPREKKPETKESLQAKLDAAVAEEKYEQAAVFRDQLKALSI